LESKRRILVVDDDAFVRKPLDFILRKEGFETTLACDGAECLESLDAARPDLIILDVMMPGRDGFEVCHAIKRESRFAAIPIILLSARWRERDRERGIGLGAADFMQKPYSPSDLVRRVRELLSDS